MLAEWMNLKKTLSQIKEIRKKMNKHCMTLLV